MFPMKNPIYHCHQIDILQYIPMILQEKHKNKLALKDHMLVLLVSTILEIFSKFNENYVSIGERNDSTIIGHLQAKKFKGSKTMFYNLPSEIDKLNDPRKDYVMKFRPGNVVTFNEKIYISFIVSIK